jgi:hypothetical protein
MKTFGWSWKYVRTGITGAQGWAWYAWAMGNEVGAWGPLFKQTTDGYIKQEAKRLIRSLKK